MASEVELKLSIPSAAIPQIEHLPWLRERASEPPRRDKIVSVYFDTPKFTLRDHGVTLRVRRIGSKRRQTIKAVNKGSRGAFGRGEWEQEITGDAPELKRGKGTALAPLATKRLRQKLKPIFQTVVERETLSLRVDGAELELAIDCGQIKSGRRREPIGEVEIELKRGNFVELARMAERLGRTVPAAYAARSKAARGYALSSDRAESAVRGARIVLDQKMASGEAFTIVGLSCLDHAVSNEAAIRKGDAEGVHQMRVGLRRLRAAISIFEELVQSPESEAIKAELRWLTAQFGPARDYDVLIEQGTRPLRKADPDREEIGELERDLDLKRRMGFDRAKTAVDSERYRRIGLRIALWAADREWTRHNELLVARRRRPVAEFAAETLSRRSKKIVKRIRNIENLAGLQRHKLRILVKKLRYACEFFATLFDDRKQSSRRKNFINTLKSLQNALGTLNDIEVHKQIAATIAHPEKRTNKEPEKAFAIGYLTGQEQTEIESCTVAVVNKGRQLSALHKFWK